MLPVSSKSTSNIKKFDTDLDHEKGHLESKKRLDLCLKKHR